MKLRCAYPEFWNSCQLKKRSMLISRARTKPNLIWLVNIRVNVFYYVVVRYIQQREEKVNKMGVT